MKQRKRMPVLRSDHTRRSSNSFNERFPIPFLILDSHFCCTWTIGQKACAMPTNGNTHVSVQRLLRYVRVHAEWACRGVHCEYIHLVHSCLQWFYGFTNIHTSFLIHSILLQVESQYIFQQFL